MITLPTDASKLNPQGATVDFFNFQEKDIHYYYFDTSLRAAPEPMVNAMVGLNMIKDNDNKLVMINHQKPMGLFNKLLETFDVQTFELDDGNYQMVFSYKEGLSEQADLSDSHCSG